jgi:WD40 repeat protein
MKFPGKRTVVGYGDGSMRLFDLKTGNVLFNMTGNNAHSGAVTSLDSQDGNVLVASGGVDGVTKVFNTQVCY